ncbi:UxaA family hydrolase [Arcticibacter sp.]|uniref:UxaA family hydrolase n=1 Tax=Arcticibacter sp. TaxID=1872630 RepID=UPI00388EBC07
MKSQNKLIKINPADNIYVVSQTILPGDRQELDDQEIHFCIMLGIGHKVAARPIVKGEKIIKFGVSIGSATEDIPAGTHVHLHNLKSDYLSTYTLDNEFINSN